jgi:hypothetical protein
MIAAVGDASDKARAGNGPTVRALAQSAAKGPSTERITSLAFVLQDDALS